MSFPNRKENSLKKLSESSSRHSGMYLIALRAHASRGRTMIREMIDSVAEALPHPDMSSIRSSRAADAE
jgi:hypothetical protein